MAIALAVASFSIISLIGLFALALKTTQESSQTILAANIASTLLAEDRVSPTNSAVGVTGPLPRLDQASGNFTFSPFLIQTPVYLTAGGIATNNASYASYGLLYQINPNATAKTSQLYMMIYWPPQVLPANSSGKYEISTQISLP